MISIVIPCVPPRITAQQKRVAIIKGKPRFFHSAEMAREEATWQALLGRHVPEKPLEGPIDLAIVMVYPHLKSTPKRDLTRMLPKTSKPDAGNASKHLEDLLAKMRFIADDAQVSRLILEKWYGPEREVGIRIRLRSLISPVPFLRGVA